MSDETNQPNDNDTPTTASDEPQTDQPVTQTSDEAASGEPHHDGDYVDQEEIQVKPVGEDPRKLIFREPGIEIMGISVRGGVVLIINNYDNSSSALIPGADLQKTGSDGTYQLVE